MVTKKSVFDRNSNFKMAFHAPTIHVSAPATSFHPDVQFTSAHYSTPTPQEPFKIPIFPKAPPKPNSSYGDISMVPVGHESHAAITSGHISTNFVAGSAFSMGTTF